MEVLRRARSAASLALALFWFVPAAVWVHGVVLPASRLFPRRRRAWMEAFIFRMARLLLWSMKVGGATFRVSGRIPTGSPCLIVGNHQSLLDPAIVIGKLCHPYVAAFVARARYASVPVVGASMRAVGCPVIDPTRNAKGAVAIIAEAARLLPHGLIIYPEGHRTRDGELLPFRVAGMNAILTARRAPVYLVVSDGLWVNRTLSDVVFNVHRIRGAIEVLGPFDPPEDAASIPAFVDGLRDRMAAHLAGMRARSDERAA